MTNRGLPLERVDNFRDYGCYAIAGGGRLREGLLYRTAHHCDASANDLQILGGLGIATVIDLRGPDERAKAKALLCEGWTISLTRAMTEARTAQNELCRR